jgi:F0F1-type ATP synthase assembly protein I
MNRTLLGTAERASALLGVAVASLCGIAWGPKGFASALVGALIATANMRIIRRLATGAVARVVADPSQRAAGRLVTGLLAKMIALFTVVWLAIRLFDLSIIPFALGLQVFVAALLAAGLRWGHQDTQGAH